MAQIPIYLQGLCFTSDFSSNALVHILNPSDVHAGLVWWGTRLCSLELNMINRAGVNPLAFKEWSHFPSVRHDEVWLDDVLPYLVCKNLTPPIWRPEQTLYHYLRTHHIPSAEASTGLWTRSAKYHRIQETCQARESLHSRYFWNKSAMTIVDM